MLPKVANGNSPKDQLYFLLWVTLAMAISDHSLAVKLPNEYKVNRKTFAKREESKGIGRLSSNFPMQTDFPYRFVFPANHPYSQYTNGPSSSGYLNHQNSFDAYSPSTSSPIQKFEILLKQQLPQYQHNMVLPQNQFPIPGNIQSANIPYQPATAPVVLLMHPGSQGPAVDASPYQTFILVPTVSSDSHGSLGNPHGDLGNPHGNVPQFHNGNSPMNLVIPQRTALPVNQFIPHFVPQQSPYFKVNNNQFQSQSPGISGLQNRPLYQQILPNKYYPFKKNSHEAKMRSFNNDRAIDSTQPTIDPNSYGLRTNSSKSNGSKINYKH